MDSVLSGPALLLVENCTSDPQHCRLQHTSPSNGVTEARHGQTIAALGELVDVVGFDGGGASERFGLRGV